MDLTCPPGVGEARQDEWGHAIFGNPIRDHAGVDCGAAAQAQDVQTGICVYTECAATLRGGQSLDPRAIEGTAQLFRRFGEGYRAPTVRVRRVGDAVKQMASIEQALGLADLARFTAPSPPAT